MTLKIAVLVPMPRTSVSTATAVNVGWRSNDRDAYRRSFSIGFRRGFYAFFLSRRCLPDFGTCQGAGPHAADSLRQTDRGAEARRRGVQGGARGRSVGPLRADAAQPRGDEPGASDGR